MLTRRFFTATALSSGALTLTGCGLSSFPAPQRAVLGDNTVDTHMHLFNGRDVPARGFLQQVVLPQMAGELPVGVLAPLADLIVGFLLAGTRTAGEELGEMGGGASARMAAAPQSGPDSDEARLATAIDGYYGQARAEGLQARSAQRAIAPVTTSAESAAICCLRRMRCCWMRWPMPPACRWGRRPQACPRPRLHPPWRRMRG